MEQQQQEQWTEIPAPKRTRVRRTLEQREEALLAELEDLGRRKILRLRDQADEVLGALLELRVAAKEAKFGALVVACDEASKLLAAAAPSK